ncbi:MAG: acyl-phosphate glycerol 3-phosphate acyltransferase [Candidatus Margulisbacteria bacterium GWF2_38_17]|nr:MAG: acyl-phosphate glycerol 3-phosphate acyltransferase [Candidatus Margulisbacteria bacterium GWD2_39_127]OGI04164.1 MAG: acyl-phosphate glycerol 3-phosphate acyltransferase [Candidatus Margulisbacteria bacterium GWF2_38_17]OGI09302.1 MAG: acyl-phosphate glycerol 3-phosphate acyltransferase [Candidatus Margulisbacteria bacterium GWE2_39_32]
MEFFYYIFFYTLIFFWGSIPYSIIVSKAKGVNLLEFGSKNAGATNVYRALGLRYAILVFLLDFLKGYIACLSGYFFFHQNIYVIIAATLAILGHTFSPFLKFKGGKGAATGLGVLLFIQPIFLIAAALTAAMIIASTRYVSLATISSSILVIILSCLPYFSTPLPYQVFLTFIAGYIIIKHKANIARLLHGKENKV